MTGASALCVRVGSHLYDLFHVLLPFRHPNSICDEIINVLNINMLRKKRSVVSVCGEIEIK